MINPGNLYPAVAVVSAHFARRGKARLDDLRAAEVGTSDQRNHARGRDGRCGSPLAPACRAAPAPSGPIFIGRGKVDHTLYLISGPSQPR